VEDARGASAILAAVRSARVLNRMTAKEAAALGLVMSEDMRRRHIRIGNGKANKAPAGKAVWMRIEVQNLPNGDEIAVTRDWTPPASAGLDPAIVAAARQLAQTGTYRADKRSPAWFGYALAPRLGLTVVPGVSKSDEPESKQLDATVRALFKMRILATEERKDDNREIRQYVVAGPELDSDWGSTDPESIFPPDQGGPE
jgi:NADH:ubiquinone oxidoreductase subunit